MLSSVTKEIHYMDKSFSYFKTPMKIFIKLSLPTAQPVLKKKKGMQNHCFKFLHSDSILLLEKCHLVSQLLPTEDPKMPIIITNVIFKNFLQLMQKKKYSLF